MGRHALLPPPLRALVVVAALAGAGCGGADDEGTAQGTAPLNPPPVQPTQEAQQDDGQATELEERRATQLGFPAPDQFPPASAQRAVAEFLDAWRDRAWDRMAQWTAVAWRQGRDDPPGELRRGHRTRWLQGYDIRRTRLQPRIATADVLIAYRNVDPRLRRQQLRLRIWRENDAGRLDRTGRWGVDPLFTTIVEGPGAPVPAAHE